MAFIGADVDELDRLARELDHAANALQSAGGQLDGPVRSAPWTGAGGDRFRRDWTSSHRPSLVKVSHELHQAAVLIRRNARQQRTASAADSGSSAHGLVSALGRTAKIQAEIKEYQHALDMLEFARNASGAGPYGYHRLSPAELKELGLSGWMMSDKTGLGVGVFKGPDGKYVVAFGGSNTSFNDLAAYPDIIADWVVNDAPGTVAFNAQELQAMEIARQLKQHGIDGSDVEYTGHSLGGQLAASAAMTSGSPAVTFGAAPIGPAMLEFLGGRDKSEELIVNYRMANDFVDRQSYIYLDNTPAGREVFLAGTGDESTAGQFDAHGDLQHIEDELNDQLRFRGVETPPPDDILPQF